MLNEDALRRELEADKQHLLTLELAGAPVGRETGPVWPKPSLSCAILFSGDLGSRMLENMVNSRGHCRPCASSCIQEKCKYRKYSFAETISAAFELPDPSDLPQLLDEAEEYLPKGLPCVDVVLATGLHSDLYLALPDFLQEREVRGLIILRESPYDAPPGILIELKDACRSYGIELLAPKPACLLRLDPKCKVLSEFVEQYRIGKPVLRVKSTERESGFNEIEEVEVFVSSPCGASWFVASQLLGYKLGANLRELLNKISLLHHAYPCTGSMQMDVELGDTPLHWAGYIEFEAYLLALGFLDEYREVVKERVRRKLPGFRGTH